MSGGARPATPLLQWAVLVAGILLAVFGPDTALGLPALAVGVVLVVVSLAWWLRDEQRRR